MPQMKNHEEPAAETGGGEEEELAETKEEKPKVKTPLKFKILKESVEKKKSPLKFRIVKEAKFGFDYLSPEAQKVGKELMQKLNLEDDEVIANTKNRIIVYTDRKRSDIFAELGKLGYERDPSMKGSSGGGYKSSEGVEIIHKNQTSVGDAGTDNEHIVVDKINELIQSVGDPIDVIFKSDKGPDLIYNGVKKATHIGKEGEKQGLKGDMTLTDSKGTQSISIKKDGSYRWSSAMKTHGYVFDDIMGAAFNEEIPELKLVEDENNPRLLKMVNPETNIPYGRVFVENVPDVDIDSLAFGPDNAKVVQRTFTEEDFDFNNQNNTLTIKTTKTMVDKKDFDEEVDFPIIQFERNASKATQTQGYKGRGITIRTVPIELKTKSGPRANNLVLDYNRFK
jgi:hypothetical protein